MFTTSLNYLSTNHRRCQINYYYYYYYQLTFICDQKPVTVNRNGWNGNMYTDDIRRAYHVAFVGEY